MRQRAENVEVGVAVRDHDAFRACGRAAGVVDGDQIVLIDLNRGEGRRFRLYQAFVIKPAILGSLQRHEPLDSKQSGSDALDGVEIVAVHAEDAGAAVVDDIDEVFRGQTVIDGNEHGADLRHGIKRLKLRMGIRSDIGHAVPSLDSHLLQGG